MNPYAARHIARNARMDGGDWNTALALDEAAVMEARPVLTCPNGHEAFYNLPVGAHICPTCGLLALGRGAWVAPRRNAQA
jgi:hypothetical protein